MCVADIFISRFPVISFHSEIMRENIRRRIVLVVIIFLRCEKLLLPVVIAERRELDTDRVSEWVRIKGLPTVYDQPLQCTIEIIYENCCRPNERYLRSARKTIFLLSLREKTRQVPSLKFVFPKRRYRRSRDRNTHTDIEIHTHKIGRRYVCVCIIIKGGPFFHQTSPTKTYLRWLS